MTIPAYIKTGKENALYSLYKFLKTQLALSAISPAPTVFSTSYNQEMTFPCVTIQDMGAPQVGDVAFSRELAAGFKGRQEQTQVELNVYQQNVGNTANAEQYVRRVRDLLKYILQCSGAVGPDGVTLLVPRIPLLDSQNSDADTGSWLWTPREMDNLWVETFIANTPDMPNVKRYRIYVRIRWWWYETAS